jgi:hypothetical protein
MSGIPLAFRTLVLDARGERAKLVGARLHGIVADKSEVA